MEDALWALGGHEPKGDARAFPWRWAAAAALLLAAALAWRLPRKPAPVPPVAVSSRTEELHPGRGTVLVLAPGASLSPRWEAGCLVLEGLSGSAWVDLPEGIEARLALPGGVVRAEAAAFGVAPAVQTASFLRDALASDAGFRLAVSRGKVVWEPTGGKALRLGEGEVLSGGVVLQDPEGARRLCALGTAWERRAWKPIEAGAAPGGKGMHALKAGIPLPVAYEMEARLRCTRPEGGAGLVYEAEGRRPICLLPADGGWHTLRVLVSPTGVELWVDGRLAQDIPAGAVARASTFETGLDGAGLAYWESGLEVEGWRWRPLEP